MCNHNNAAQELLSQLTADGPLGTLGETGYVVGLTDWEAIAPLVEEFIKGDPPEFFGVTIASNGEGDFALFREDTDEDYAISVAIFGDSIVEFRSSESLRAALAA